MTAIFSLFLLHFSRKKCFIVALDSTLDNFSYLGKGKFYTVTLFQIDPLELFRNVMQTLSQCVLAFELCTCNTR